MEKILLVVPQYHSITRSYSGKANLSNYVKGHDYESKDFFASHGEEIPMEEATPEKIKEVGDRLYQLCKSEVEIAQTAYLNDIRREANIPIELTGAERKEIVDIIVAFEAVITSEDVKKVSEMVIQRKSQLNETQLEFLRFIGQKANQRTLS